MILSPVEAGWGDEGGGLRKSSSQGVSRVLGVVPRVLASGCHSEPRYRDDQGCMSGLVFRALLTRRPQPQWGQ